MALFPPRLQATINAAFGLKNTAETARNTPYADPLQEMERRLAAANLAPDVELAHRRRLGLPLRLSTERMRQGRDGLAGSTPSVRRQQNPNVVRMPWGAAVPLLKPQEVLTWLRRLRYDPQFRHGRSRVPWRCFADRIGVHRDTLYKVLANGRVSGYVQSRVTWGIAMLEAGHWRYRRVGRQWEIHEERPKTPITIVVKYTFVPASLPQAHQKSSK